MQRDSADIAAGEDRPRLTGREQGQTVRRLGLACAAVAVAIGSSGCSDLRAQLEGAEVVEPSVDASYAALPTVLETAEWSVTDGLVSVIVRNDTDRDLRTAEVTMTARDENGEVLGTYGTSSMGGDSSCCTVQSLAPGEEFGLYFAVGEGADRIDDVELTYSRLAWAQKPSGSPSPDAGDGAADGATDGAADGAADGAQVNARATDFVIQQDQTVVRATVEVGEEDIPRALVQAILRGRSGKLIAVVTGRWSCFEADSTRRIRMELFQPVPLGTGVDSVSIRPIGDAVAPRCS